MDIDEAKEAILLAASAVAGRFVETFVADGPDTEALAEPVQCGFTDGRVAVGRIRAAADSLDLVSAVRDLDRTFQEFARAFSDVPEIGAGVAEFGRDTDAILAHLTA